MARAALVALLGSALVSGCAHTPLHATSAVAPPKIHDDDDYARERARYDALQPDDPSRPAFRAALLAFALDQADKELATHHPEAAWDALRSDALPLFDYPDLARPEAAPRLLAMARELERVYRQRGAHLEAMTCLAVEVSLAPDDAEARTRFQAIVAFLRNDSGDPPACDDDCARAANDLEATQSIWPSPFVTDQLVALHQGRLRGPSPHVEHKDLGSGLAELLGHRESRPADDLARALLRVGRLDEAKRALDATRDQPGGDPFLTELLDKYLGPSAIATDALRLEQKIVLSHEPPDPAAGLALCRDAARRFPTAAEPELCLAAIANERGRLLAAIAALERARQKAPGNMQAWKGLAQLEQRRLGQLGGEEDVAPMETELADFEALHREFQRRFPGQPLEPSLADGYLEVGRGYYNAGRIEAATAALNKSIQLQPSAAALEQLGEIALKRGRAAEALDLYKRAEPLAQGRTLFDLLLRARIRRGEGDAHELAGDEKGAEAARARASDDLGELIKALARSQGGDGESLAEALLDRGKLLYQLGERDEALETFDQAIEAMPDRGATYADALAFLVTHGERDEAHDVFHRALARGDVSEYLKVYCSLWILDLDRRAGQPEDPKARAFLATVDGPKWYHDLARWASGRESDAVLAQKAHTVGNRAELDFYQGLRQLEQGRLDEARAHWRRVLDTGMMAFFEYDMASYYLRRGAPAQPIIHPRPRLATPPSSAHVPNDSI